MDEMTQQNSALVEQSAAAAKALEKQAMAMAMQTQIGFFRISGDSAEEGLTTPEHRLVEAVA